MAPSAIPSTQPTFELSATPFVKPSVQPTITPTTDQKNEWAYVISDLIISDQIINVSVTKISDLESKLIIASYTDDNVLVDINSADILTDIGETSEITMKLNLKNAAYVKAFVWDDFDDARPLSECLETNFKQ